MIPSPARLLTIALVLPLSGCGTLWYGSDSFSSVEESREWARERLAASRAASRPAPLSVHAVQYASVTKGDVVPPPAVADRRDRRAGPAPRPRAPSPQVDTSVAAEAPRPAERPGPIREAVPVAVPRTEVAEVRIHSAPRASATQIRDAIFTAWNRVMPEQISSRSLFNVDPGNPQYADKGERLSSPDAVIDRRVR